MPKKKEQPNPIIPPTPPPLVPPPPRPVGTPAPPFYSTTGNGLPDWPSGEFPKPLGTPGPPMVYNYQAMKPQIKWLQPWENFSNVPVWPWSKPYKPERAKKPVRVKPGTPGKSEKAKMK